MGGIIRSNAWWWDYFKNLFHIKNYYVSGSITIGPGRHEIEIPTDFQDPSNVFLCVEEPDDGGAVCLADLNWVAAKLRTNGFILFADVKGNSCTVKYVVEYSGNEHANPNGPIVIDG